MIINTDRHHYANVGGRWILLFYFISSVLLKEINFFFPFYNFVFVCAISDRQMVCGQVLHHLITPFHWHGVRKTLWATDSLIKKRKMGRSAGFNKSSAGPTVFPTHSNTSSFSSFFSLCLRLPIKRKKLVSREATTLKESGKKTLRLLSRFERIDLVHQWKCLERPSASWLPPQ